MRTLPILTARQLVGRRFGVNPLASILVAVLVLLTTAVAAAVPRIIERQGTAELAYQLTSIGDVSRSLQGSGNFLENWYPGTTPGADVIYGALNSSFAETRDKLPLPLRGATGAPIWIAQTPTLATSQVNGIARRLGLRLTADQYYQSQVSIVAGKAPAVWAGNDAKESIPAPIQILLSTTAAKSLRVSVGDVLGTSTHKNEARPSYRISGLYRPTTPSAQFWKENPSLVPAFVIKPDIGPSYLAGSALLNPLSVGRLSEAFGEARLSLYYPLKESAVDGADSQLFREQVAAVVSEGIRMPGDGNTPLAVSTGAAEAISTAIQREVLLSGFLALLASAPIGVTLAVLGLGVQAVARARRTDIALVTARGADSTQVRLVMAVEGLALSVPGAIVATVVAALFIPVPPEVIDFVLPAVVALSPGILFAALSVPIENTSGLRTNRGRVRIITELAVLLLAALALALLSRRGLAQSSAVGIDPLLVATPLLLSAAVGIVVLRGYPIPLRVARVRAARSRGLESFVGSIRATRSPTVGLVGVLALVVGISIAIFSTVMLSTFDGAIELASQQRVGADVRVEATSFSLAQRSAVSAVPGVRAVAGIEHLDPRSLRGTDVIDTVDIMISQTNELRSLRPRLVAGLAHSTDGRIPVVLSADLVAEVRGHSDETLDGVPVRVVGSLPSDSRLGPLHSWVLVDSAFANRFTVSFTPDLLLVRVDANRIDGIESRVDRAAGRSATVESVASVTNAQSNEPTVQGVRIALLLGAGVSVLLCAIALVLSTIVAARARARTAGILRTLGMRQKSLRSLVAWELVPVIIVAVVAGTLLGLVLPFALTAAVDLRPFTDGATRPGPLFNFELLGAVLAAFCVIVALVGVVAVAAGERLNPSTTLKMGAE